MQKLAIVFWDNGDFNRMGTSLYLLDTDPLKTHYERDKGISIAEFFEKQLISLQKFQKNFPGFVIETHREKAGIISRIWSVVTGGAPSWQSPLTRQSLPYDKDNLQRLSKMLAMQISVFIHEDRSDDPPKFEFSTV